MTIQQAQKNLAAANLRLRAAHSRTQASAYISQASKPAYPGQAGICYDKAAVVSAFADTLIAQAGVMEAVDA